MKVDLMSFGYYELRWDVQNYTRHKAPLGSMSLMWVYLRLVIITGMPALYVEDY